MRRELSRLLSFGWWATLTFDLVRSDPNWKPKPLFRLFGASEHLNVGQSTAGLMLNCKHAQRPIHEGSGGHAHRFRDTFAVELLLAGVPLERVSVLLGHSSVKITQKHYNPWVLARQEQLEADVMRTWSTDERVLASTKGTP